MEFKIGDRVCWCTMHRTIKGARASSNFGTGYGFGVGTIIGFDANYCIVKWDEHLKIGRTHELKHNLVHRHECNNCIHRLRQVVTGYCGETNEY